MENPDNGDDLVPVFVMALTEDPNPLWPRFRGGSGRRLISVRGFFLEAARRQNQPFPSTSDVLLSVSNYPKVSDSHLKLICNSLRCLLMWYGKRSHDKKVHQITASDEEPGGVMHETFDQQDSEI